MRAPSPIDIARLVRLPNVFTAFADILLGACACGAISEKSGALALMLSGSGVLYLAGMALNDFFDRIDDAKSRPDRPIPSGRVSPKQALLLGLGLLAAGVVLATMALAVSQGGFDPLGWNFAVAPALAAAIVLYDKVLKHGWLGPIGMGLCRALNVLLGCSLAPMPDGRELLPYHLAGTIGLYIAGVTWFARKEEATSRPLALAGAAGVMALSLAIGLFVPEHFPPGHAPWFAPITFIAFVLWLGTALAAAIRKPSPKHVQTAVKRSIFGLVLLDAILACFLVGWPGLLIALLLIPAMQLGRRLYST